MGTSVGTDGSDLAGTLGGVLGELVRVGEVGALQLAVLEDDLDGGSVCANESTKAGGVGGTGGMKAG